MDMLRAGAGRVLLLLATGAAAQAPGDRESITISRCRGLAPASA